MTRALALGAAAIALAHAGYHAARGEWHDLLWLCNLAVPLLALGCALRTPRLAAIALLWLAFGTPMWLLDLMTGGEVIATSLLTHLVGPLLAVLAVRELGWARGSWLLASAAAAGVLLVSWLVTPPRYNVNLVFSVWAGWERYFPSHALYLTLLVAGAAISFFTIERMLAPRLAGGA